MDRPFQLIKAPFRIQNEHRAFRRFALPLIIFCLAISPPTAWSDPAPPATQPADHSSGTIPADDSRIGFSPYVWKKTGAAAAARAEATMPGAYLKLAVQSSKSVQLLIDGSANKGCPPAAMPVVDSSIDHGPFTTKQLTITDGIYPFVLAENLDSTKPHQVDFFFRSASLGPNRWQASTVHVRIAGVQLDPGGSLAPFHSDRALPSASATRSQKASVWKVSARITRTC